MQRKSLIKFNTHIFFFTQQMCKSICSNVALRMQNRKRYSRPSGGKEAGNK